MERNFKKKLTPEKYRVLREKWTEAPFRGRYWNGRRQGIYIKCRVCGAELFSSETKFDSGAGWPSFSEPANRDNIELKKGRRLGIIRTEVVCKKRSSHLGHVFDDRSKAKGGKQFCINLIYLELERK